MTETKITIDTIPLLRLLGDQSHQMLSRGEAIRQGISDVAITEAAKRQQIVIGGTDDTRDGERSSFASLILTDVGETVLDEQE